MDDYKNLASMRYAKIMDASSKLREDGFEGGLSEQIEAVLAELERMRQEAALGPFDPVVARELAVAGCANETTSLPALMQQAIAAARVLHAQMSALEVDNCAELVEALEDVCSDPTRTDRLVRAEALLRKVKGEEVQP